MLFIQLLTQQSTYSNRNTCFEMFSLEVDGGLGYGEDAEGGDEGGHQVVHVVKP